MQISGCQAQRMGQQRLATHTCGLLYGVLKTWWCGGYRLPKSAEALGLPTLKMGNILAGK